MTGNRHVAQELIVRDGVAPSAGEPGLVAQSGQYARSHQDAQSGRVALSGQIAGARAKNGGAKGGAAGGATVAAVRLHELTARQHADWEALYAAQGGAANPFCSPLWVTAWYGYYVPREDQRLMMISDRDRLVGVAPMYRQRVEVVRLPVAQRLALVGGGRTTPLEVPQILSAAGHDRAVARAVVRAALTHDVSWSELTLTREQGWLDAVAASTTGLPVFQRHQQARACVVLRLGDTWDETRSGLKRNIKESLRRARNRLARDGRAWRVVTRTGRDLDHAAIERLLALHAARSQYQGSSSQHHNAYADLSTTTFLRGLLPQLARHDQAALLELDLDGEVVAAQLVLRPPNGIYFLSSGFLPQVWDLSPVTALQAAAMEQAIARGDRWVNFSLGPNEAKLRWSDQLAVVDDFAFGPATAATMARFTAFFLAKDVRQLHRERAWALAKTASGRASG